ncbi:hypothetical protein P378_19290 [Desulforamulus profundi]|uniref:Biotin carboxyl carrier protein of acetyl-CoA carboxylase n=1 Tax=Desulforamulus profundi TaxID=1383067 RepID=A0A2C6LG73_9FIRM|nr:hypothetical protein P378_19290 [Desulforamulus profundi]
MLTYAMFPQVARKFFEARKRGETGPHRKAASIKPGAPADASGAKRTKEAKNVNLSELKELIKVLDQTDITEIDLESDGVKVSIRKGGKVSASVTAPAAAPAVETPAAETLKTQEAPIAPAAPAATPGQSAEGLVPVTAPMVGTFYQAPAPDADPFVKVGDVVQQGQTLCIIEAMKLMNEIEAEVAGEVVEILVENGQPVEYGQKLFLIKKK